MDKIGVFFQEQRETSVRFNIRRAFLREWNPCEPEEAKVRRASVRFNARRANSVGSVGSV